MRRFACVLFWLIISGQPALFSEIPEELRIENSGRPYAAWVIADRVLTPAGDIDPSLFSPSDRSIISRYLRQPPRDGCVRLGQEDSEETTSPQKPIRQNLVSTVKSSGWVFSATVTARSSGFSGSTPGTLLEIVPEETFKGPRNRTGPHYIFMPVAMFAVDGTKICKTDERYAAVPEIGERVFLFIDLFWRNEGRFLWTGEESGIITVKKGGSLSLPRRYRNTEPGLASGGESDLLRFIEKSVRREN